MKTKQDTSGNVLARYSILVFVVVVTAISFAGFSLSAEVEKHIVRMHADFYAGLVRRTMDGPIAQKIDIDAMRRLPHIDDAVVWDSDGGMAAESTSGILSALTRTVILRATGKMDPTFFAAGKDSLVILVPVFSETGLEKKLIGLLESDESLKKDIDSVRTAIVATIFIAGAALYLALFGLFWGAYKEQKKTSDNLQRTFNVIIFAMSSLSGLRDEETGGHLERTAAYSGILLGGLRRLKKYRNIITASLIDEIVINAPLHDIGKVGVADAILRKPGKLTPEEYEHMKFHSIMGADILAGAAKKLPFRSSLAIAEDITRYHHERWDGKGYPEGLTGEKIPLAARIVAIADVYDALRSARPYKEGFNHSRATEIIRDGRGTQFDPDLVDVFLDVNKAFAEVYEKYSDGEPS